MTVPRPALALCAALTAAACSFNTEGSPALSRDAAVEPDADTCGWPAFSPRFFDTCAQDTPARESLEDLTLGPGDWTADSDLGDVTDPDSMPRAIESSVVDGVRVFWFGELIVADGATLTIEGSLPVMIVGATRIRVDGAIDVSSNDTQVGAGANPEVCGDTAAEPGQQCDHGAGGGGGGAFGNGGGNGGRGGVTHNCGEAPSAGIRGGAGGTGVNVPATVRGGCPGAPGAEGDNPAPGAEGDGGGAIHLVSPVDIEISGTINAGGAGGIGANAGRSSGGGGGAGGYIGLEAPDIQLIGQAILAANGGGGGGGADGGQGGNGQPGQLSAAPAGGGPAGNGNSGAGGPGGATADPGGTTPEGAERGGGGGGGGAGFVLNHGGTLTMDGDVITSPPIMLVP